MPISQALTASWAGFPETARSSQAGAGSETNAGASVAPSARDVADDRPREPARQEEGRRGARTAVARERNGRDHGARAASRETLREFLLGAREPRDLGAQALHLGGRCRLAR